MGSIILTTDDGTVIPISFDITLTVMSLIAAVSCVHLGLEISLRDRAYARNKLQIAEMTVEDARGLTLKEIRSTNLVTLALFKDLLPLMLGGIVTSSGIVVMHYIGMRAVIFPGRIVWDIGIVVASIIIAIITSATAFWILFRLLALYPHNEIFRLGGAVLMAFAVMGMHYTGAAAASFEYNPALQLEVLTVSSTSELAVLVTLTVGIMYPFLIVFLMFADIRTWLNIRTKTIDKIDALVKSYQNTANSGRRIDIDAFAAQYHTLTAHTSTLSTLTSLHSFENQPVTSAPSGLFDFMKSHSKVNVFKDVTEADTQQTVKITSGECISTV